MTRDDHFEWDPAKDVSNQALHGLSFSDVRGAFDDPFAREVADRRQVEERWVLIALIPHTDLVVVVVVYTERGDRERIISARGATKAERESYFRHRNES